jgi:hypothetical protein
VSWLIIKQRLCAIEKLLQARVGKPIKNRIAQPKQVRHQLELKPGTILDHNHHKKCLGWGMAFNSELPW